LFHNFFLTKQNKTQHNPSHGNIQEGKKKRQRQCNENCLFLIKIVCLLNRHEQSKNEQSTHTNTTHSFVKIER